MVLLGAAPIVAGQFGAGATGAEHVRGLDQARLLLLLRRLFHSVDILIEVVGKLLVGLSEVRHIAHVRHRVIRLLRTGLGQATLDRDEVGYRVLLAAVDALRLLLA